MEPKPIQRPPNLHANVNSVVLFLICAGICWLVKMVSDLQVTSAVYNSMLTSQASTIEELRRSGNEKSTIIQSMDVRLSNLETTVHDHMQPNKQ